MTWAIAIALAAVAFAVAVLLFRLPRATWTSLAAALVFGLAGYTLQASPAIPGAPKSQARDQYVDEWEVLPSRQLLITGSDKSRNPTMITADAFARQGRFEDASAFLRNVIRQDSRDFEAWVALGSALTEQADGNLTQASVYAYRQANLLRPDNPAPGYFLGLALIRQGRMMEARSVWRETLESMDGEGAAAPAAPSGTAPTDPRAFLADRVGRLETMLQQVGAMPQAGNALPSGQ
jgi:cytochrome c-type biogenesis protein CcmH